MYTLKSKIDARLEARRNGETGLALLDVLLGMAIFALIAVIAVQAMGQFRERAYVSQVTSDVKQLATGIEGTLTEPNAVWADVNDATAAFSATEIEALGVNLTGANTATVVSGGIGDYVICVTGNDKEARYDAEQGKVISSGDGDCS